MFILLEDSIKRSTNFDEIVHKDMKDVLRKKCPCSGPYFSAFVLNTERYRVSLYSIWIGEIGSRISPNKVKWWHFSHSDCCINNTGEYDEKQKELLSKLLFFSIHVWWTFQIAIYELAHLLPMVFIPTVHWLTTTKANLHTFSFRA